MFKSLFYIILFVSLFISCSDKNKIKDTDKFARLYVELLINQEKFPGDTTRLNKGREEIFRKFTSNEKQYQSTIKYYNINPDEWKRVFDQVKIIMDEKRKAERQIISKPKLSGKASSEPGSSGFKD